MPEKILLVDDEPAVLQGLQRLLRAEFTVVTALGGKVALLLVKDQGPFAVVVSDMRMPEMDGIEFLRRVKSAYPDTVRIMLTGNADLRAAADAVNQGSIFRFLTKPCSKEDMVRTLNDALAQHRLICAEKELLEKTLRGLVHVLTEVLSVVSPTAFNRAARARRYVQHVAERLSLANPWRYEVAAMLSQLGCITLEPEIIEILYTGGELSPEQEAQFLNHPQVARELLRNIPRMEPIAWMIAHQNAPLPAEWNVNNLEMREMRLGAQLIRAALAFERQLTRGQTRAEAVHFIARKFADFDERIAKALMEMETDSAAPETLTLPVPDLVLGMVLQQEVRTRKGTLVAAQGQEVSSPLLLRLKSLSSAGYIDGTVAVSPPKFASAASEGDANSR